jgi:hypothetical protein
MFAAGSHTAADVGVSSINPEPVNLRAAAPRTLAFTVSVTVWGLGSFGTPSDEPFMARGDRILDDFRMTTDEASKLPPVCLQEEKNSIEVSKAPFMQHIGMYSA